MKFFTRAWTSGVDFTRFDLAGMNAIAGNSNSEQLYDEVDLGETGGYIHRMLFYPKGEVEIWFSNLEIRKIPKQDRSPA